MSSCLKTMKNDSGQTLIEVVVALSIAIVVLGALVVAIVNGVRNAKFAQNQAIATKYAQDTVEELRAIRDRNLSNSVISGINNYPLSVYLGSSPPCSGVCNFYYFTLNDSTLVLTDQGSTSASDNLGNGFTRAILMCVNTTPPQCQLPMVTLNPPLPNLVSNEKLFIIQVSWVDVSGSHSSNLQTVLAQL